MKPRWQCTACGELVARRRNHPPETCGARLVGLARSAQLLELQRRVDELNDELGEPARERAS